MSSIPIQGPGFVAVYAAVTATTVVPLDVMAEELLGRATQALER